MTEIKPVRDGTFAAQLDGALTAAAQNGWDWPRAGHFAANLIFTAEAEPGDLIKAVSRVQRTPRTGTPPSAEYEHLVKHDRVGVADPECGFCTAGPEGGAA